MRKLMMAIVRGHLAGVTERAGGDQNRIGQMQPADLNVQLHRCGIQGANQEKETTREFRPLGPVSGPSR